MAVPRSSSAEVGASSAAYGKQLVDLSPVLQTRSAGAAALSKARPSAGFLILKLSVLMALMKIGGTRTINVDVLCLREAKRGRKPNAPTAARV
jgi:hypothetical protein